MLQRGIIEQPRSSMLGRSAVSLLLVAVSAIFIDSAESALLFRDIDGNPIAEASEATFVYDDDRNLTWLRDWTYARTSGASSDGCMNWAAAVSWADNLQIGAFGDWRLPSADSGPSSNCYSKWNPGEGYADQYYGGNCTGSEIGHLWITELGNTSGLRFVNVGPFINMIPSVFGSTYWTGTPYDPDPENFAWAFTNYARSFVGTVTSGSQGFGSKESTFLTVAVRSGDVVSAVVPEPATPLLFGLGLAGLTIARGLRPSAHCRILTQGAGWGSWSAYGFPGHVRRNMH